MDKEKTWGNGTERPDLMFNLSPQEPSPLGLRLNKDLDHC